jgi:G:T-mismatch repair DNA endonuclease (very short patch repair protein)
MKICSQDDGTIFAEALRVPRPAQRHAHFAGARAGNQELREQVDSLLQSQDLTLHVDQKVEPGYAPSNRQFWNKKISRNKVRDRLVTKTLRASGWRVLRIS